MDFVTVVIFIILFYARPQELFPALEVVRPVLLLFIVALLAMVLRPRGFHPRELLKTPHEWLMLAYFTWIVAASGYGAGATLLDVKNLIAFFFVITQALYTRERLTAFLWWWLAMIVFVALLALDGEYGFDLFHSYDLTHNLRLKGRLVLNTKFFDNPNDLGHNVVVALPMLYLLGMWQRELFVWVATPWLMLLPAWCVYLTQSKGGYLSGACATLLALVYGRARLVQVAAVVLAVTLGVTALSVLPRMNDIEAPGREEGIRGRTVAFVYGLEAFKQNRLLGYRNFQKSILRDWKFDKASHSAYVEVGAELGWLGLFLHLALLYCGLRTLLTARTASVEQERIRRVLLAMLAAHMITSWMSDFAYHVFFFVLMASIAAFHRQMLTAPAAADAVAPVQAFAWNRAALPAAPAAPGAAAAAPGLRWNRYGLIDLVLTLLLLGAWVLMWQHFINWAKGT